MSELPCGCCEPPAAQTPLEVSNRAGLSSLSYRVGTYASFRETMLDQIAGAGELSRLTTREDDDYAITLVDLWAAVADVLTFYEERYANEAFLRTATQRVSIARLARLIDYSLRPGVAAFAWLAFTVEDGKTLTIPRALPVQSVPGQNEKPQTFETLEQISADARLNDLRALPAPYGSKPLAPGTLQALVAPGERALSAALALAAGDTILLYRSGAAGTVEPLSITAVEVTDDRVTLRWQGPVQAGWDAGAPVTKAGRLFRLFGHTAPTPSLVPVADSSVPGGIRFSIECTNFGLPATTTLALDARVDGLAAGARLLVNDGQGATSVVTVTAVTTGPQSLAGLTDTVTMLSVTPAVPAIADRRYVTVYELLGDEIALWGYAYPERLAGASLFVAGKWHGDETVEVGRTIVGGAYQPGVSLSPTDIAPGRRLLVGDAQSVPVAATVVAVALCGPTVAVQPTPSDASSAAQLGLDAGSAGALRGLLGEPLPSSLSFTRAAPALRAQIGDLPIRPVTLVGAIATPADAAGALRTALLAAGPEPQWTRDHRAGGRRPPACLGGCGWCRDPADAHGKRRDDRARPWARRRSGDPGGRPRFRHRWLCRSR